MTYDTQRLDNAVSNLKEAVDIGRKTMNLTFAEDNEIEALVEMLENIADTARYVARTI